MTHHYYLGFLVVPLRIYQFLQITWVYGSSLMIEWLHEYYN